MKINIAIDGPSASGKSTVAKLLCKKLGYVHLDTGAMYRCVGLKCLRDNLDYYNDEVLLDLFEKIKIELKPDGSVYLDGENVSKEIRTNEVSMAASNVSTMKVCRQHLVALQQEMAKEKGFIMDGRDIGTVVLKDAEVKVFMTASVETRAMRRHLENLERGMESDLEKITKEVADRDYQDTHRENSPLVCAEDATPIDTSNMTLDEVVDSVMKLVEEKI